jgi:hypothetical protein
VEAAPEGAAFFWPSDMLPPKKAKVLNGPARRSDKGFHIALAHERNSLLFVCIAGIVNSSH